MEAVQTSIAATLKSFHCEICDKKYANVGQYDEVILPSFLTAAPTDLDAKLNSIRTPTIIITEREL